MPKTFKCGEISPNLVTLAKDLPDRNGRKDLAVKLIDECEEEDDQLVHLVLLDLAIVQGADPLAAYLYK